MGTIVDTSKKNVLALNSSAYFDETWLLDYVRVYSKMIS